MLQSKVFRYSYWDLACCLVIPFQIAVYWLLALNYEHLSLIALLAMVPVLFALSLQNAGANHNHYHTPFFRIRWMNTLVRMGFSMTEAPKTPYNIGHGIHHVTHQSWNDTSILRILGLKRTLSGQLVNFGLFVLESVGLKYLVLLILLKHWPLERVAALASPDDPALGVRALKKLLEPSKLKAAKYDLAAWFLFRLVLCLTDWQFFFFYFIPVTYLIDSLRQGENYFQHWGATDPFDPKRDSVSCYGKLYNWLTFNLGYHQEHHYKPGVHWLKLPELTKDLPSDRHTVPYSHYLNAPLMFPQRSAQLRAERAAQAPQ
ncbi:fatty acid desaturase [Pseudomonas sp. COR58]|uniref:Fatty acid desaturase n=1 Tax=Pseudomonas ekonensis TaxID=2842353 RepID=A0ABS6PCW4_9PSED|nr:fatty acid desaturase [Pseudomonas ekonensis]MBV4458308.1 fatty acid desaturase [Pseudomonas ekonensis]